MPNTAAWFATNSEVPAFTSGPDGTLTGWTGAAERLLQVHADEVLGSSQRCRARISVTVALNTKIGAWHL